MILLLFYVGIATGFSFLCSILEASFLAARVPYLIERSENGHKGAGRLLRLRREQVDDCLSSILILNTIAHTAGAALAGAQAEAVLGTAWVKWFTAAFILLILVGSEIVPKTLGVVWWRSLVGFTGWALQILIWAFSATGMLFLARIVTRALAHGEHQPITRSELSVIVATAAQEGTLRAEGSKMVSSVLLYDQVPILDVMTPRTMIAMLPAETTLQEFIEHEEIHVYSRIPLYEGTIDQVIGWILQREVLLAAAQGADSSLPLRDFARKPIFMPEAQTVAGALRRLTEAQEHLAFVTDEFGGLSGLVTVEDLIETTLGIEILDESDRVTDLRAEALRLREKRLQNLRQWRDRIEADEASAAPDVAEDAAAESGD